MARMESAESKKAPRTLRMRISRLEGAIPKKGAHAPPWGVKIRAHDGRTASVTFPSSHRDEMENAKRLRGTLRALVFPI